MFNARNVIPHSPALGAWTVACVDGSLLRMGAPDMARRRTASFSICRGVLR